MTNKKTIHESDKQINDKNFELWRLLDHTGFMISRSREKELSRYGLSPEQAHILYILNKSNGATTIQDILKITMRQHHSISTLVNRMSMQGLVNKARSKEDARRFVLSITEKGQALFRSITRNSIDEIFSGLSEENKKGLDRGLKTLLAKAYQALGKKYQPTVSSE
jgi:DNA-binding MarR family transcriptional regulator